MIQAKDSPWPLHLHSPDSRWQNAPLLSLQAASASHLSHLAPANPSAQKQVALLSAALLMQVPPFRQRREEQDEESSCWGGKEFFLKNKS